LSSSCPFTVHQPVDAAARARGQPYCKGMLVRGSVSQNPQNVGFSAGFAFAAPGARPGPRVVLGNAQTRPGPRIWGKTVIVPAPVAWVTSLCLLAESSGCRDGVRKVRILEATSEAAEARSKLGLRMLSFDSRRVREASISPKVTLVPNDTLTATFHALLSRARERPRARALRGERGASSLEDGKRRRRGRKSLHIAKLDSYVERTTLRGPTVHASQRPSCVRRGFCVESAGFLEGGTSAKTTK
jgi:hypothetical protein